jgi:hypothetical protein
VALFDNCSASAGRHQPDGTNVQTIRKKLPPIAPSKPRLPDAVRPQQTPYHIRLTGQANQPIVILGQIIDCDLKIAHLHPGRHKNLTSSGS